ncbi:hypothetical protein, partial [Nocardioides sp. YIM 152588]|uniref:hypothetical protein n=1 Tax=Nocardioides sp. YIM 152588 TaxID=3158259 RepID=UPI0032E3CADD
ARAPATSYVVAVHQPCRAGDGDRGQQLGQLPTCRRLEGPQAHAPQAEQAAPQAPQQAGSRRAMVAEIQAEAQAAQAAPVDPDAAVAMDDAEVDAESGADLLARELGARMIEEIPNE